MFNKLVYKCVPGAQRSDVISLTYHGQWLTNFQVKLILTAFGAKPDTLLDTTTVVLRPESVCSLSVDVRSASLNELGFVRMLHSADVLLVPLNVNNNHWLPVRMVRACSLVEVFLLTGTEYEQEAALTHVNLLVKYAQHIHFFPKPPQIRLHTHPSWKQNDGCSCGLLTVAILLSLIQGRRIAIDMGVPYQWRKYFMDAITMHLTLHQASVSPPHFS